MATAATAEITFGNHDTCRVFTFAFSSFFSVFILDVLSGPFLHTILPHDYPFSSPVHTSATSHAIPVPNDRPPPLITTFFRNGLHPTFNDLLQSSPPFSLSVLVLLSHYPHELCPLSFLIIFPFRLTLRCHLYPQSTLVSPEFFFPLSVNVLFSFAYRPPSPSILAHSQLNW